MGLAYEREEDALEEKAERQEYCEAPKIIAAY
jgi:hypothetical protein